MEQQINLSDRDRVELLKIAREGLAWTAAHKSYNPSSPAAPELHKKAGAFVTLKEGGELRGCIGYIEARLPLFQTVAETAGKAASCDPRFDPVKESELDDIEIEISVLSPLVRITDTEEVVVGKHGLLIEKGYYRGLLLPQVATENSWNREEFLDYTCLKAGLRAGQYRDEGVSIYTFTADVFGERDLITGREDRHVQGT